MTSVIVIGAGGHAKVVIDVLRASGHAIAALFDDTPGRAGESFCGATVIGPISEAVSWAQRNGIDAFIVAIGDNAARLAIAASLERAQLRAVIAVHPSAVVSPSAVLGAGTVVMPGVCINADAKLGAHVIVNTRASIDHDCVLDDGVHLGPGVTLSGHVKIGARTLVGVGACVAPSCRVGRDVVVGAGAAVVADIPDSVTVKGVPARS